MRKGSREAQFFDGASDFRRWLEKNHDRASELWVGFYEADAQGMTWGEAVDQALCFGWTFGARRGVDDQRYKVLFVKRSTRSRWSGLEVERAFDLLVERAMERPGLRAFGRRLLQDDAHDVVDQRLMAALKRREEKRFRANRKAWRFFQAQGPAYRRSALFWICAAKDKEARKERLLTLIERCAEGETIRKLVQMSAPQPKRR